MNDCKDIFMDLGDAPRTPDDTALTLAWERGTNLFAEELFRRMNTDESRVREYTLPALRTKRKDFCA